MGQGGNWDLIFSDDFDTLDTSTWEPGWFSSSGFSLPVNQNGAACYHPNQIYAAGGELSFVIDETSNPGCVLKDGSQGSYMAGLINTRNTFTFSYGYAEARIFFPSSTGGPLDNWPAFWHTGFDWPATGEVDIAEGLSGGVLCSVYHYEDAAGTHQQDKDCVDWPAAGWHVVAANWEPGKITYYYDGVEVFATTTGVVGDPHYLIVNYTTRNDGNAVAPSTMVVDYVRVWTEN